MEAMKAFNGDRELKADEYIKDGLVYCKKCNTAKQTLYGTFKANHMCECESIQNEKEEAEKVAKIERDKKIERYYRALPYEAWRKWRFDRAKPCEHLEISKKYSEKFAEVGKSGLLFYGDVGGGKTFLQACIANAVFTQGYSVKMRNTVEIVQDFQGWDMDEQNKIKWELQNLDLFIVDDLGAERNTPFAKEIIYSVIDSRLKSGKPMIVSTNYSLKRMREEQDLDLKRIFERVMEACVPLLFTEKMRSDVAKENAETLRKILGI